MCKKSCRGHIVEALDTLNNALWVTLQMPLMRETFKCSLFAKKNKRPPVGTRLCRPQKARPPPKESIFFGKGEREVGDKGFSFILSAKYRHTFRSVSPFFYIERVLMLRASQTFSHRHYLHHLHHHLFSTTAQGRGPDPG